MRLLVFAAITVRTVLTIVTIATLDGFLFGKRLEKVWIIRDSSSAEQPALGIAVGVSMNG